MVFNDAKEKRTETLKLDHRERKKFQTYYRLAFLNAIHLFCLSGVTKNPSGVDVKFQIVGIKV